VPVVAKQNYIIEAVQVIIIVKVVTVIHIVKDGHTIHAKVQNVDMHHVQHQDVAVKHTLLVVHLDVDAKHMLLVVHHRVVVKHGIGKMADMIIQQYQPETEPKEEEAVFKME